MTDRRRERWGWGWRPVSTLHYDRQEEGGERERGWRPVSTLHYDRQEEGGERERGVEACLYITL